MATRRDDAIKSFAIKNLKNDRFRVKWFVENAEMNLRCREKYRINKCNSDRLKNGPLNHMRRLLNEMERNDYEEKLKNGLKTAKNPTVTALG